MNIISYIILLTILFDCILNIYADILNLKMLNNELPLEFKDVYDSDKYEKSQEYLRVNTKFSWIVSLFDLSILLVFWFCKGFPLLDNYIRSWNYGPILSGIFFIGILSIFKGLLSLPFAIYSTFVIEQRFGFNKTTWQTFIKDILKGLILGILLGIPLIAAVLGFFEYSGQYAWLYCWIAVTIFMLFVHFITPTWILPFFNKFVPLEDGNLRNIIMEYAKKVQFPLKNVFVIDGSKRSTKSNAFFCGFGKNKRIALYDTLIDKHSDEELLAIIAHEVGHYKKKHILWTMLFGILHAGLMFYLLSLFMSLKILFDAFYMENISIYAGLIFFSLLLSPMDFFIELIIQMFSRKNEYSADNYAVQTTGNSESIISALKKLSVNNLSNLVPHPFYVFLNYSHPPVLERIKAIKMTKENN